MSIHVVGAVMNHEKGTAYQGAPDFVSLGVELEYRDETIRDRDFIIFRVPLREYDLLGEQTMEAVIRQLVDKLNK